MKIVLIKLSGELLPDSSIGAQSAEKASLLRSLAHDIKTLLPTHRCAFVVGGGNFFRARKQGKTLALRQTTADSLGVLATVMNALMINDIFGQEGLACSVLSALAIPSLVEPINQNTIDQAIESGQCIIFAGGLAQPFFTTDTTSVVRALQIGAKELWKGTNVPHIFSDDPAINPQSIPLDEISHQEVLDKKLKIMDSTAIALAQEHQLPIRVFNIFDKGALLRVAQDSAFGSTIR